MTRLDLTLKSLSPDRDEQALQKVLEAAPRYSLNISGLPQPRSAAADVFSAVPEHFDRNKKFVFGIYQRAKLVGCADVLRGFPEVKTALIGLLLLAENSQGRGIGRIAYEKIEIELQQWPEIENIRILHRGSSGVSSSPH